MPRLFLIDNNLGYVFADTANLVGFQCQGSIQLDAIECARLLEARDHPGSARTFEFQIPNPRDTRAGYHVYSDKSGSDLVIEVTDGEDKETIDDITNGGDYEGFVSCIEPD